MEYAYATFLMRGDGYLPGALVLAYALRMQTKHDLICLVTQDVSIKAQNALGLVYDKVIPVEELRIKSSVATGRSDRNLLMTRLEALRLGKDGGLGQSYDKVILLDADVLPICNYDTLSSLPAPAGIIMESRALCYSGAMGDKWSWHHAYEPICPHGTAIPATITQRVATDPNNMGVNAGLWVLEPSLANYQAFVATLNQPKTMAMVKNFPWPEMQLATLLWSGEWTNIDIKYCSIGGYPSIDVLYGMHFAGLKPWHIKSRSAMHYAKYPDFALWRQYFMALYWANPDLQDYPMLRRLYNFCNKI